MGRVPPLLALVALLPAAVLAQPAFAPGTDPELDRKMENHGRYFYQISARPFGIGIMGGYKDASALQTIEDFLSQAATDDFQTATGVHPYTLLSPYEGASGVGLRGGGAVPGTAFRYMALKAEGAPADQVAEARGDVVRAINAVLVAHTITGVPRVLARGIARMKSDEATGPADVPLDPPTIVPLSDPQGNPLPTTKNNGVDRADNSGGTLPADTWYWDDSCSKDQMDGWVLALATLYDAAKGDPDIDPSLVAAMEAEAREIGAGLRETHPFPASDGQTYDYDLVIMDSDGRPTLHWDLNPLSVDATVNYPPGSPILNRFNLVMGLGIVKALYHVSGDPDAETFLYGELLGNRGYLEHFGSTTDVDYTYLGAATNYSNVNMIAIALFLNIWFEKDPLVLARTREYMETQWWDLAGVIQSARNDRQPYFDALYLAMTAKGFDASLATGCATLLKSFSLEPYLDENRNNCDPAELAAFQCTAIDGTTQISIQHDATGKAVLGRGGHYVATEPLDPSIRPTSDFDAASDPFQVNTSDGSTATGPTGGLMPGGDLHAAYWLLRWLPQPGVGMTSPNARDHMPVPGQSSPDANPEVAEAVPDPAVEMASEVVPDVAPGTIAEAEVGDVPQADPTGKPAGGFQDAASTDGVAADSVTGAGSGGGCTAGRGDAPAALLVLAAMGFLTVRRTTRRRRHDGLQARLVAALAEAGLLARQLIQPAPRTAGRRPSGC